MESSKALMEKPQTTIKPETLSALSVLYESGHKNPIQVLVPIFINTLYKENITSVSAEDVPKIKNVLASRLGLDVPTHIVDMFFEVAGHQGFLIKNKAYKPMMLDERKAQKINYSFLAMEEANARRWDKLRDEIIRHYDENGYESISKQKIDNALLDFIKYDSSSFLLGTKEARSNQDSPDTDSNYQDLLRVSMCIKAIAENPDSESYQFLIDLCLGNAFASSIFWWDDKENTGHLANLDVYLDSPILFRLLGFGDDGQQDVALDLVKTLKDRGANLRVFEHVLSEVLDVFEGSKIWIGNPEYDASKASKTTQKVIEQKLSPIDLEKIIADIPETLESYGIQRTDTISANETQAHQIDEVKLHQRIAAAYEMRERNLDTTIDVDVRSINYINKLRSGEVVSSLDKAKAVLCTSNRTLSRVSFEFEQEEYGRLDRSIPLCITDGVLVTVAWLESPSKGRRIAQRRMIAQVNTLVEPTTAIKMRFCDELKKRRESGAMGDAEYLAIVRESSVNQILAKKTGNDLSRFTAETVDEVIDEMIEEKTEEKNRQIEQREKEIKTKNTTIAQYRAREEKKADRMGNALVGSFVVVVSLIAALISFLLPEYIVATIPTAIIVNLLLLFFPAPIKQLGARLYKHFNPDLDEEGTSN